MPTNLTKDQIAISWCLAWGNTHEPSTDVHQWYQSLGNAVEDTSSLISNDQDILEQVQQLQTMDFPNNLQSLETLYPGLYQQTTRIGLVYGGATKIKAYVFEASKLQDIRGASALLDRINIIDLPAMFGQPPTPAQTPCPTEALQAWLSQNFPGLRDALIPELIIYSTGGNILALCPAAYADTLANAIERRYTEETQTANACAVATTVHPLQLRLGLLRDEIKTTPWLDWYQQNANNDLVTAYFGNPGENLRTTFEQRQSFNALVAKLVSRFNHRRSGNEQSDQRPVKRYPPMFETHPYLRRDDTDQRSTTGQISELASQPWFSEPSARKYWIGQKAKRTNQNQSWFLERFSWQTSTVSSWVAKYEAFINQPENAHLAQRYNRENLDVTEARSLYELGNVDNGFVAYIYADGNNMGGYIQTLQTASAYRQFSIDISETTEYSLYEALATCLEPHQLKDLTGPEAKNREGKWIHPFEILTIGGDDVFLIVPAAQALAIAEALGNRFEARLCQLSSQRQSINPAPSAEILTYTVNESYKAKDVHRYQGRNQPNGPTQSQLSMSTGVLIAASDTPIYYAEGLVSQLLKSAKQRAKELKQARYHGGTVDVLAMKGVTMLSSEIKAFRKSGLFIKGDNHDLKLYASPFTLYELSGLRTLITELQNKKFPKSQLYQIRDLLDRGKSTSMLNYRYFRVRLDDKQQELLREHFEEAWCQPQDPNNKGNLAPWRSILNPGEKTTYETLWRDLVDLYALMPASESSDRSQTTEVSS